MSAQTRGKASWKEAEASEGQVILTNQRLLSAAELSPLANSYTIRSGPPKTILVPNASKLAQLQEVSVSGTLLAKQFITLDPKTNKRTIAVNPGGYTINPSDGDL